MKVGILGGTFDPPHIGHIILGIEAALALKLTTLIYVPAWKNRLKTNKPGASPQQRYEMVRLAVQDYAHAWEHAVGDVQISDFEIKQARPVPAIETLLQARELFRLGKENLYLILGGDNVHFLYNWTRTEEYGEYCQTVLVKRGDLDIYVPSNINKWHNVQVLSNPLTINLSSTEIRKRIGENKMVSHLVPPTVHRYIVNERLYL
jgi:nicotinate-nucleotide adenylyltransferase